MSSRCFDLLLPCRAAVLMLTLLLGSWAAPGQAQQFQPDLGLAPELIDGGFTGEASIPADASELQVHPMPEQQARPLLTELPEQPFRQVDPAPQARRWWKYPIYLVVGFPRDVADSVVGSLRYIPVISTVAYAGYELVPTQTLLRDPRDWHRWDGDQNRNGHGWYDGNTYGHFPSWNQWDFTYPDVEQAEENREYNDHLREQLQEQNRAIEAENEAIAARKRNARNEALTAIQAGDGAEAVRWMLPYEQAYPLDSDGVDALLATGLALYGDNGPQWVRPYLWDMLNEALPGPRMQIASLMETTREDLPQRTVLNEALIYTHLLNNNRNQALSAAQTYLAENPNDVRRQRLVFEVALSARNRAVAEEMLTQMDTGMLQDWEQAVLQSRMQMLRGDMQPAVETLEDLAENNPENAYIHYYLGVAQLQAAQLTEEPLESFREAFRQLELAALQAPTVFLRRRAGESLAYARAVLARMSEATQPVVIGTR